MPSQAVQAVDALAALRAATADQHARLDSRLPIARDGAQPADYAQHLAIIGDWLAEIDRLPLARTDLPGGWPEAQRARRERIAADLADFSAAPASGTPASQPPATPPAGFGWGVAYVVEGSQLGGLMLYRRLRESLQPHALRYLQGDGGSGAWPRFLGELRAAIATPAMLDGARTGAEWAFASLGERFEDVGAMA
ncbi:heme oxygenase [Xylophilus rhododendri]|uniref:Heme oxygenase n=1 Tax=Xylophilus rhododendri TaxID=2697032 RepID=A0A857J4M7_9BURK|nr:biliverdin-producing heme oxygenase [Xylophilus rhododendri]QHI98059.1 heme oxygenase [Xylophilus rhododendri]